MIPDTKCDATRLIQRLDKIGPNVREALAEQLTALSSVIAADAKARAQAHIRYLGAKNPGSYVESIRGGVSNRMAHKVIGYVRSGHPLAHLMENGFTITAMDIAAKSVEAMKFTGSAGAVYARLVHRPSTNVPAYPAIQPAFEARRAAIDEVFAQAVARAGADS